MIPASAASGEVESVVTCCDTGHWDSTNWFVPSEIMGYVNVRLYDASMTGWKFYPSRPLETGRGLLNAMGQWINNYRR